MLKKMQTILRSNDICVLATVAGDIPHCSLMAYAVDEVCRELYMVTHKTTKKYQNLLHNSAVSLLIDTREAEPPAVRPKIKALTVNGRYRQVEQAEEREQFLGRILQRHPYLESFAAHPDAEVVCIRIESLYLLDGVTASYFESLGGGDRSMPVPG